MDYLRPMGFSNCISVYFDTCLNAVCYYNVVFSSLQVLAVFFLILDSGSLLFAVDILQAILVIFALYQGPPTFLKLRATSCVRAD